MILDVDNFFGKDKEINLSILLLDNEQTLGGNKYYKLKYNLEQMRREGKSTLLTFGGAYSNHIAAVAQIGNREKINTIGIIRGEELNEQSNNTLKEASKNGMQLYFVTREEYRKKESPEFINRLINKFGDFYLLPEGGSNSLAVKGCTEILTNEMHNCNFVSCAIGTGATFAGIAKKITPNQQAIGFSAVANKGWLEKQVANFINDSSKTNWQLNNNYHFGAYGAINKELVDFYYNFKEKTGIELDLLYSAKMMYGLFDLVEKNYFKKGTSVLAIHTGGTHGNKELLIKNGFISYE